MPVGTSCRLILGVGDCSDQNWCSGQGECVAGRCVCPNGYIDANCSVRIRCHQWDVAARSWSDHGLNSSVVDGMLQCSTYQSSGLLVGVIEVHGSSSSPVPPAPPLAPLLMHAQDTGGRGASSLGIVLCLFALDACSLLLLVGWARRSRWQITHEISHESSLEMLLLIGWARRNNARADRGAKKNDQSGEGEVEAVHEAAAMGREGQMEPGPLGSAPALYTRRPRAHVQLEAQSLQLFWNGLMMELCVCAAIAPKTAVLGLLAVLAALLCSRITRILCLHAFRWAMGQPQSTGRPRSARTLPEPMHGTANTMHVLELGTAPSLPRHQSPRQRLTPNGIEDMARQHLNTFDDMARHLEQGHSFVEVLGAFDQRHSPRRCAPCSHSPRPLSEHGAATVSVPAEIPGPLDELVGVADQLDLYHKLPTITEPANAADPLGATGHLGASRSISAVISEPLGATGQESSMAPRAAQRVTRVSAAGPLCGAWAARTQVQAAVALMALRINETPPPSPPSAYEGIRGAPMEVTDLDDDEDASEEGIEMNDAAWRAPRRLRLPDPASELKALLELESQAIAAQRLELEGQRAELETIVARNDEREELTRSILAELEGSTDTSIEQGAPARVPPLPRACREAWGDAWGSSNASSPPSARVGARPKWWVGRWWHVSRSWPRPPHWLRVLQVTGAASGGLRRRVIKTLPGAAASSSARRSSSQSPWSVPSREVGSSADGARHASKSAPHASLPTRLAVAWGASAAVVLTAGLLTLGVGQWVGAGTLVAWFAAWAVKSAPTLFSVALSTSRRVTRVRST